MRTTLITATNGFEHVEQMASAMKMGRKVLKIWPEHVREIDTAYKTYSLGTRNKWLENVE